MENSFQFVDSGKIDRTTRKLMRSHVMKGKNAGKTVHRRSKLDLETRRMPCDDSSAPHDLRSRTEEAERRNSEDVGSIPRNLGHVLRTFPFPVELADSSLKSIDQFFIFITERMYPSQLGLSSHEYKHNWLQEMFTDENASFCSLALMASTNEFFTNGGVSSPKALSYLSHTLALVKKRMESEVVLSDSTICMVMMLILQEQIRHEKESRIHYEALRKMIELRGGLPQLENNPVLLLKMAKMDILYTLQHGAQIFFFQDRMTEVRDTLARMSLGFGSISTSDEHQYDGMNPYLQAILCDTMSITRLFNNLPFGQTLDLGTFLEMLTSICCRLIRFRPLRNPKPESKRDAAYHIGMIVFMTTLFLQWDNRRIREYDLISQQLKEVLDDESDAHDGDLLLWLLFIASLWFSSTDRKWLILKIEVLSVQLGIDNWSRVRELLSTFPWINKIHDPIGSATWDLVQAGS